MVFKKFLGIALTGVLLFTNTNVYASSLESHLISSTAKSENVSETKVPENEVAQLEHDLGLNSPSLLATSNDTNEPNNTIETAFPYRNAEKITCSESGDRLWGHYNCFYTPNQVSSIDDLDFYKLTLQPGMYYVAILKNVYTSQVRDLRLYYQKSDGSWWYKYPTTKDRGQSIFHFTAEYSTYYARISGDYAPGETDFDTAYNWFAVERDGTIDERLLPYDSKPSHALQ